MERITILKNIETPEGNQLAAIDGRMLDEIKSKINFLSDELWELKKQLLQENKRSGRRAISEKIERAEFELRWLRYQEEYLNKSIMERR